MALNILEFLETAETVTENQSGYTYINVSICKMCKTLLMKKCKKEIHNEDVTLKTITEKMMPKL